MKDPKLTRASAVLVAFSVGCAGESAGPERLLVPMQGGFTLGALEGGSCRLVENAGQQGLLETFQYNSAGLAHVYNDQVGRQTTFTYNAGKRLTAAKLTDGEAAYNVRFVYDDGRIARELSYDAATGALDDIVVNTYNARGKIVRRESLNYGFYATFAYDAVGNAYQVDVLGTDGYLFIATTYQFTKPVKDPHRALPGLPYGVPYINEMYNPWRQTAAKSVVTDENGNLLTLFDQDPARSILRAGPENYATFQSFFDKLTATFYSQEWDYQGCGGPHSEGTIAQVSPSPRSSAISLRGTRQDLQRQIVALRRAYNR